MTLILNCTNNAISSSVFFSESKITATSPPATTNWLVALRILFYLLLVLFTFNLPTTPKHSGMNEKSIEKVFEHVFIKEHYLRTGLGRFPPDYEMAESFKRLEDGTDIQLHDRLLPKHEWLELGLMRRYNYDYNKAHRITERKYNYSVALTKWLKERGDW